MGMRFSVRGVEVGGGGGGGLAISVSIGMESFIIKCFELRSVGVSGCCWGFIYFLFYFLTSIK